LLLRAGARRNKINGVTRRRASITLSLITALLVVAVQFLYSQAKTTNIMPAVTANLPAPGFYKVVRDVDGDTMVVDMAGTQESVRMIGIDTPETHKPDTPVQCFGPEAANFTKQKLQDKTVRLEADPTNDNRDRYNRLLRYVYLEDGNLLQQEIIEQGFGFAYLNFPFQKKEQFAAAQASAKAANRGLWAACQPFQESGGRWQTNNR
jgi:micrococcal nuclease